MRLSPTPQLIGIFVAGDVESGFYSDLRHKALEHRSPHAASAALASMTAVRRTANPVSVAQLGIGAWQLSSTDRAWLPVVADASRWIAAELDAKGRIAYLFPMPHTFDLRPPWYSAMAQGEAASLLLRAGLALGMPALVQSAVHAVRSLIDGGDGLVTQTPEGPVLEEYPTTPPSSVLNGWISGLWGLYDVGLVDPGANAEAAGRAGALAREAFAAGCGALAARLHLYEAGLNWSRYDVFPHRIANVASPFYHRLHVEQLRAMARLRPDLQTFGAVAERWAAGARSPVSRAYGLTRKVAFRALSPRRRARA